MNTNRLRVDATRNIIGRMKSNNVDLLMRGAALFLCLNSALAGQPAAYAFRGSPIRGEPIGGVALPIAAPATNSVGPALANKTAGATNNPVSTPKGTSLSKDEKFLVAGFDKLSGYNLETGNDVPLADEKAAAESARKVMDQIPASVKALNEKQVAVRGFMLPMKVEKGIVTEFLLLKNQMGCCYGMSPGLNEWIDVRTTGNGVKPQMDDLITVCGTLHLGAIRENGYLTGLYKMDCEKIQPVQ